MKDQTTIKIYVKIKKNGKLVKRLLRPLRFSFWINREAKKILKRGSTIDIKVTYLSLGKDFTNTMKNCTYDDLMWCKEAFVKEYL